MEFLRAVVSKKKVRYTENGFNLDLTYISDRIIAMGYPSIGAEKLYRNPLEEVIRFFSANHPKSYKVFNLCQEKQYDPAVFGGAVEHWPFWDHQPPPFEILLKICQSLDEWLSGDPKRVAAIHCKAGKGRTGLIISCYLLHCGICKTANDALSVFGALRTANAKGVTLPSQKLYVHYYEKCLKGFRGQINVFPVKDGTITLKSVIIHTTPRFDRDGGCDPFFYIQNQTFEQTEDGTKDCKYNLLYNSKEELKIQHYVNQPAIVFNNLDIDLKGDLRFSFYDKDMLNDEFMFSFWVNTNFVDLETGKVVVQKPEMEGACKDHNHKKFDENFSIELFFALKRPAERKPMGEFIKADVSNFGELKNPNNGKTIPSSAVTDLYRHRSLSTQSCSTSDHLLLELLKRVENLETTVSFLQRANSKLEDELSALKQQQPILVEDSQPPPPSPLSTDSVEEL